MLELEPAVAARGSVSARTVEVDLALLDALVREHRDAAVAYATRILGDGHLAEDAVQRALLQILVRVRAGDEQLLAANPRAVVLRGTRWAALKLADRHSSRDEAERRAAGEALGGDDHDWDRLEARMLIEDILPSLPEHYRDVLRLRYLEGRSDATAAESLEVTLKAYRRRLDRALAVARMAALRIGVTSLGAGLVAALRRARGRVQRVVLASDHGAWAPVSTGSSTARSSLANVVVALAVVSLMVGTPLLPRGMAPHGPGPGSGEGLHQERELAPAATLAGSGAGLHADGAPLHLAGLGGRVVAARGTASGESLDDVQVAAVVPAPHAPENHTVVAEGYGQRCGGCHLFLQTGDAGATWNAYPAPATTGILLPPDYPRDPRLFLRTTTTNLFCVEARIADATCTPVPNVPPGTTVLDPRFDSGSPLVYVSTPGGVLAVNLVTSQTVPLEINSTGSTNGIPMVAAGGPGPYAVYMLVRGSPAPRGQTVTTESPTQAAPVLGTQHLVGCRSDGSCITITDLPSTTTFIYGDLDDPTGLGVLTGNGMTLALSTDGGLHHRIIEVPGAASIYSLEVVGSGSALQVSAISVTVGLTRVLVQTWRNDAGWLSSPLDSIARTLASYSSTALGHGRVIVGLGQSGRGMYCSADDGERWSKFCA